MLKSPRFSGLSPVSHLLSKLEIRTKMADFPHLILVWRLGNLSFLVFHFWLSFVVFVASQVELGSIPERVEAVLV